MSQATLDLSLHPAQAKVFHSPARFKAVAAGRRFGKTQLAVVLMGYWGMQWRPGMKKDIFYVAPTFQQAKDVVWNLLKDLLGPIIAVTHENTGVVTLLNGVRIHLKGSDRPDTLRGVGLLGCVIDEYADMKPHVWEEIISPALSDAQGPCVFIGTPKGRNHFFLLCEDAQRPDLADEWAYFHFTTYDNPYIPRKEIESAKKRMSTFAFEQEFMASFQAPASDLFKPAWVREVADRPRDGIPVITVDPAGFEDEEKQRSAKNKVLDETVITTTWVHDAGWWVEDQDGGRWGVRETARRIILACMRVGATHVGIEKGIAFQALLPYLREVMVELQYWVVVVPLTHGNTHKTTRVVWALQGRLEHGRLAFKPGKYLTDLKDQLFQFPDSKTKDDRVDSLAYVDQMVKAMPAAQEMDAEEYDPLDPIAGY